jgi:hypothetical protein
MKLSRFLVALALVAITAGSASAQLPPPLPGSGTTHLWWNGCDNAATKSAAVNIVDGSTNTRAFISMNGRSEGLQGYKIDVRLRGAGNVLGDAWHFEAGGCADGGFTPSQNAANASTCPLAQGGRPLFIYQYTLEPNGEGYMQVGNAFDPFAPDPSKTYTIYRLNFDFSLGCPGFGDPTCLWLYYVETLDSDSIPRLGNMGNRVITANDAAQSACPGTVPAHQATWGQIKNQYR